MSGRGWAAANWDGMVIMVVITLWCFLLLSDDNYNYNPSGLTHVRHDGMPGKEADANSETLTPIETLKPDSLWLLLQ